MVLQSSVESTLAAKAILGTLRNFSVLLFVFFVGMLRQMYRWQDDYSAEDKFAATSAITGIFALLVLSMILNIEAGHILTVMRSHPGWGILIVVLTATTVIAVAVAGFRNYRESQKIYDIVDTDDIARTLSPATVWGGLAAWLLTAATAVYWLWQISRRQ